MTQTQTNGQTGNGKATELEFKPMTRLTNASFVESVAFDGGEHTSAAIGRNVEDISVVRLEANGRAIPSDGTQRADGLLLRRRKRDLGTGAKTVQQAFVPWSNVRSLGYGE